MKLRKKINLAKQLLIKTNGRSGHVRFNTNDNVYVASLAKLAPLNKNGEEREPTPQEWKTVLQNRNLVTPPGIEPMIYSRVVGIFQGSIWQGRLTNRGNWLAIPPETSTIS
ncbi:MAG: DUF3370 family protein [cyanobacterium endosymbiont of Rhopalodia yunnanensis]